MKNLLCCLSRMGLLKIFFTICLFSSAKTQHFIIGNNKVNIELGVNFGPAFFLGDLGGHRGIGTTFIKDVNLELTKIQCL